MLVRRGNHEFNLLENSSGSLAATEEGVLGSLLLEGLKPERDGFLYIFAINETSNPIDFDNLIVAHKTGTLLTANHYYPFGLRWNGQGSPFQKYQFGGKEYEEELNLNTYDFHARQMDPVLGRFWGVDPMCSERVSFSPFNYAQNNPMNRVDPTGMLDESYRNRLQNTDGSSSDYEGNNFIETRWTETNLELLIGTEFEDMIGQIAYERGIEFIGDGDPTKKVADGLSNTIGIAATGVGVAEVSTLAGQGQYKTSKGLIRDINYSKLTKNSKPYANTAKDLKLLGNTAIAVTTMIDIYLYRSNLISGAEFSLNSSATAWGVGVGLMGMGVPALISTVAYQGINSIYPGGVKGAIDKLGSLQQQNQQIIPNFKLHRD